MAKDKKPPEALIATARHAAEHSMDGFRRPMSVLPWSNTNLNRILLKHATQNVTATFAFVQKLSQAKNFQEVVKIQTEFMQSQMNLFNEEAKILGEMYTKAAAETMKHPFGK